MLDTGNGFLTGEPPLQAAVGCAPHTCSSHSEAHFVERSFRPPGLTAGGAVPRAGAAQSRSTHKVLLEDAPVPTTCSS